MATDVLQRRPFPRRPIRGQQPADGEADQFVPVYDGDTGETIRKPDAGHVELGSVSTRYSVRPRADRMLDLGQSTRQFEDGWFKGELAGNRIALPFGHLSTFSVDQWLKMPDGVLASAANGLVMPRAGGIVGGGLHVYVNAHTTDGLIALRFYKNGSGVMTFMSGTITSGDVGSYVKAYGTAARSGLSAAQKFAAGDFLGADVYFVTFAGTLEKASAWIELVEDT